MRRMVWMTLGAAGGILAYRKLEEIANESVDKGLVLTVMDAGNSAKTLAVGLGEQFVKLRGGDNPAGPPQDSST